MVGITSYGAYIPLWRLDRKAIGGRGEKPICNFDEDAVTMAVAAANDCLKGVKRETVDGLLFASTNFPYDEKQSAAIVAAGADLRRNIVTADFAGSLKAGTTALRFACDAVKAGSAKQIMVTAGDRRQGAPLSGFDRSFGDGAAALLVGDTNVIASLEASYSVSDEMLDIWRSNGETFPHNSHERFAETEGYVKLTSEAITGLLKESKMQAKDFAKLVVYAPNPRRAAEVASGTGFNAKTQLQDCLGDTLGNTGVPYPLMLFVCALETAKAGDLILVAGYGDGADALAFRVTDQIDRVRGNAERRGMKKHLETKRVIDDFKTYWLWRGLLNPSIVAGYLPHHFNQPSAIALWRERNRILRLHGVKCQSCGLIQYPPQRVCSQCHTRDRFEEVRLADRKGKVFTLSMDSVSSEVDTPIVVCIVHLEGGGRILCYMTDRVVDQVKVGMEVEMSFRKMQVRDGIHNYFWKAIPVRA
jgi:hydroxymethylglutaryl-CoA synthase